MKIKVVVTGERTGINGGGGYKATLTWYDSNRNKSLTAWSSKSWEDAKQKVIAEFKKMPVTETLEIDI